MRIERINSEIVKILAEEVLATVIGKCDIESETHIKRCLKALPNTVNLGKRIIVAHEELEEYTSLICMMIKKYDCIAVIQTSRMLPVDYHKIISDFKTNACESIVSFDTKLDNLMIIDIVAFKPCYNHEMYDINYALSII